MGFQPAQTMVDPAQTAAILHTFKPLSSVAVAECGMTHSREPTTTSLGSFRGGQSPITNPRLNQPVIHPMVGQFVRYYRAHFSQQ